MGGKVFQEPSNEGALDVIATDAHEGPKNAKFAILQLVNEGDVSGEIALRAKGAKTTRTYRLEPKSQYWATVPLAEGKFQAKVSSLNCKIYLRGYIKG